MISRRDLTDQVWPTLASAAAVTLTSFALAPTLGEGGWLIPVLAVVGVVAVVGIGLRALAWPGWLVVLGQTLALVAVITWMYAADAARLMVIPGPAAWEVFRTLVTEGSAVIEQEVAPITVTTGVQFFVVTGVALVALVVDAVAVTWRRATLAGIPLLTLYLVPAVVLPDGVPWPLFLLAGVGWLLLLLTDGRRELLRWGRPVGGNESSTIHSVGGTGRRLGAAALAIAVIVPVVLPSLEDGRFGLGGNSSGDGNGNNGGGPGDEQPADTVLTVNPIVDLRRDLVQPADDPVFNYQTDAITPEYFRVATLDQFNGTEWSMEQLDADSDQLVSEGVPSPPGVAFDALETTNSYYVYDMRLSSARLPQPYPVAKVEIDGDWRYDAETLDVFTADEGDGSLGQEYTTTQWVIQPTPEELRQAAPPATAPSGMTDLPEATESYLEQPVTQVTQGASSDYDKALAIQNWLRTRFEYSLETVEGYDDDALQTFLEDRSGYCEQFAATMALMARMADIPARVVVGYTPGQQVTEGTWQITQHDAHAWPELWFEGAGWVRFEPTPGGGDGGGTPTWAPDPTASGGTPDPGSDTNGGAVLRRGGGPISEGAAGRRDLQRLLEANRGAGGFGGPSTTSDSSASTAESSKLWLVVMLVVLTLTVAVAPIAARELRRRRRWKSVSDARGGVDAAWDDILDAALDVDVPALATETPRDVAGRLPTRTAMSVEASREVQQLALWLEQLRYGSAAIAETLPDPERLREVAERVRGEIFGSLSSRDRRAVSWWPASGRRAISETWRVCNERLSDVTNRATHRARTAVLHRG